MPRTMGALWGTKASSPSMPAGGHAGLDLGQVLVVEHLVGLEVVGPEQVVGAGGGAGAAAAGAGGGAGRHPADGQPAQGQQGQLQGGGEAAGRGDPPGAWQGGPVPFRQAVDEPGQVLGAGVGLAVGLGEHLGVLEPEVAAQVHQQQPVLDAGRAQAASSSGRRSASSPWGRAENATGCSGPG